MEIRTSDEAKANILEFSNRYLNLAIEKKKIDDDIKALKQEFNEEGVPTSKVLGSINRRKVTKKKSDSEIFEEEVIDEYIASNSEIDNKIGLLIAK